MKTRPRHLIGGEDGECGDALSACHTTTLSTSPPLSTLVVDEHRKEKGEKKRGENVGGHAGGKNREVGGEGGEVVSAQKTVRWAAVNENGQRIGESHPRAVLSDHEVELMLALREEGFSYGWLAKKFEVTRMHAWRICTGVKRAQSVARFKRV